MEECWSLVPLVTHCPRSDSRSLWRPITSTVTDAVTSLVRLLSQIPNIVISEEIGLVVQSSVNNIVRGSEELGQGNLEKCYSHGRKALELSETAFFDKSLLKLLYFPDDQKYAIYIPLFLPVGIPVLLSLKTIYLWMKGKEGN